MNLQCGSYNLDTNLEKMDLEDLLNSKANLLSIELLKAMKEHLISEMREAVQDGNIAQSNESNGYLKCIEDFAELFQVHLRSAIKEE